MSLINNISKNMLSVNYLQEYDQLSKEYNPVDLGLGFPNYLPPKFVTDALSEVISTENAEDFQYTSPNGHPKLRQIVSKLYSHHINKTIDPNDEVLITAGSSEALFCAILGLIKPGDEVIVIEPCFMVFVSLIQMAGAVPVFLRLKLTSNDWVLDTAELEQLFNTKTKAVIVNTPHNPTGKVFDLAELSFISNLCIKWNTVCISDEVYERMVFKPKTHIRVASLPGMFERTVTICAAEKSFGVTGWQIGWVYGPSRLLQSLKTLHQFAVFNASTPLQIAFAKMFKDEFDKLDQPNAYFSIFEKELRQKRDYLVEVLLKTQIKPIIPDGGMFILGDFSQIVSKIDLSSEKDEFLDLKFVKWLTKNHRLQTFPVTIFCSKENIKTNENLVRFCFAKKQETLEEAANILMKLNI